MNKGISLLALGSEGYMWWAVNMACSVKHFSAGLPVQLIASGALIDKIKKLQLEKVFDYFTEIAEEDYLDDKGKLSPGKAKLKLTDYFIFERTIYLDVDGCVIKDLSPLFDLPTLFAAQVNGTYQPGVEELPAAMYWCKSSVLMKHYGLAPDVTLPALNSSFLLLSNMPEIENLFAQASENLNLHPIPAGQRHKTWGRGKGLQPDELYLNIACAQLGIYPDDVRTVYFRNRNDRGKVLEINDIRKNYYVLGLYGSEDFNHVSLKSIYNRNVRPLFHEFFPGKHFAKAEYLMTFKIANFKIM